MDCSSTFELVGFAVVMLFALGACGFFAAFGYCPHLCLEGGVIGQAIHRFLYRTVLRPGLDVHHGVWDCDIPCAPILCDIVVDGKPIKAAGAVVSGIALPTGTADSPMTYSVDGKQYIVVAAGESDYPALARRAQPAVRHPSVRESSSARSEEIPRRLRYTREE